MAGTSTGSTNGQGNINSLQQKGFSMGGSILNYGFIGIDSFMRMKDGEAAPVAVGKALLTNAAFSMIPGGIVGAMGLMTVAAAPELMNQLDRAAGGISAKKQQFGGNFRQSESQLGMLQQGLGNMQSAQTHAVRRMANHARGAQKVY